MTAAPTSASYAVVCLRDGVPRFFLGRFDEASCRHDGLPAPRLTAAPDRARAYDDRAVADLIAALLNVLDGVTADDAQAWTVTPLPEAWLP
ncbi:hypothetical protein [Rhodopseudomonas palustris]|uniref:Uncharacterized protein n=1 Tax=Rhodopseudomonas palustris TaxID=1076 RepID=A0A418V457_RHOPL|nr:hypothetical protein [Rhodopseudomonas palustris]RJF70906.1 hypothetical protein D4Q52_14855 [Rhodopseudomonas palustris]